MYAVIKTGGKQYKVTEGDVLRVEKLNAEVNTTVELTEVLLVANGDNVKVGTPVVAGAKVVVEVLSQGKGPKVVNFKYKPKKALNFGGDVSISATALEDSDIFIYLAGENK